MRKYFAILFFLLFGGCVERNPAKETAYDGPVKIELLFEYEGCKMYRFRDGLRIVYWSDCRGTTEYSYQSGGKTKTTHHVQQLTN